MIIIIGKEAKAKILECAYYVSKCSELLENESDKESRNVAKYCHKLSDWLFNIAKWPKKS